MANQFDAKICFYSFAWRARDPDTEGVFVVVERYDHSNWTAAFPDGSSSSGTARTALSARAACRRAAAKYKTRVAEKPTRKQQKKT